MVIDYDVPLKKLSEEFVPHSRVRTILIVVKFKFQFSQKTQNGCDCIMFDDLFTMMLLFSKPELKACVSIFGQNLSSSVIFAVFCKLLTFSSSFSEPMNQLQLSLTPNSFHEFLYFALKLLLRRDSCYSLLKRTT